jgi:hypothetical protein
MACGAALVVGLSGCGAQSPVAEEQEATTDQLIHVNFEGCEEDPHHPYKPGMPLDGQCFWEPVQPGYASPMVVDNATDDPGQAAKLLNHSTDANNQLFTASRKATRTRPSSGKVNCVAQVRVNDNVPAVNINKGAFVIGDSSHAAAVKFNLGGQGIAVCGANYEDKNCPSLFPGDHNETFQHVWYRVSASLDLDARTALIAIGVKGQGNLKQGVQVKLKDPDDGPQDIGEVAMFEYGRVLDDGSLMAGALLVDNILCVPVH